MSSPALHRWSGWPGAWCLDRGATDQNEVCVAEHDTLLTCVQGHVMCQDGHAMQACTDHTNGSCPSPGSRSHDPYGQGQRA